MPCCMLACVHVWQETAHHDEENGEAPAAAAAAVPVQEDPVRKNLAQQMEEARDPGASSSNMLGPRNAEKDRKLELATKALEDSAKKNKAKAEFQETVTAKERDAAQNFIENADETTLKELLDRATARYIGLKKAGRQTLNPAHTWLYIAKA